MKFIDRKLMLSVLVISFAFGSIFSLKADELDLSAEFLEDELINLFASKRATSSEKPKQTRLKFIRSLPRDYVAGELNMVVFDSYQGKLVPISNKMKVNHKEEYAVNFESYKGNFYAYIYQVSPKGNVTKLFPSGKQFRAKNPVFELVKYGIPNSNNQWLKFSSEKGWNIFYFFLSRKPVSLKSSPSVNELDKLLANNMRKDKTYLSEVKDQAEFNKKGFNGKVHSNMLGFKDIYSEKIVVWNKG